MCVRAHVTVHMCVLRACMPIFTCVHVCVCTCVCMHVVCVCVCRCVCVCVLCVVTHDGLSGVASDVTTYQ